MKKRNNLESKPTATLKSREDRGLLKAIIDNIPDQIYFKDTESRFLLCNPAVTINAGTDNTDELIGKTDFDFFPVEDAEKYFESEQALMRNFTPLINHEEQIVNKRTGEVHWNLTTKIPYKDQDGNLLGLIGINRDITDIKKAEKILEENEARLKELNAAKDKFFSIIAHDLKSPFNAITGFSQLLVELVQEKKYDGIEEYAGIIENASQLARDLLMNLLDWSRSQTGRMEFFPESIEIVSLINEVVGLLSVMAHQKKITIVKNLPEKAIVFADKPMISTVLRNLISNAIKFTKNEGKVVVFAEQKEDELFVTITDDGVGIKKEAIEKLFRIDVNYSTEGTHNEKGTGLGLILCKEFVEKHGGKIWIESEEGKGTKMSFALPNQRFIDNSNSD